MYHDMAVASLTASVMVIVVYHLPNLENVIFRHTTDHPGLIMVPSEVTMNELQEHRPSQLIK